MFRGSNPSLPPRVKFNENCRPSEIVGSDETRTLDLYRDKVPLLRKHLQGVLAASAHKVLLVAVPGLSASAESKLESTFTCENEAERNCH